MSAAEKMLQGRVDSYTRPKIRAFCEKNQKQRECRSAIDSSNMCQNNTWVGVLLRLLGLLRKWTKLFLDKRN